MGKATTADLRKLARLYGIQLSYRDIFERVHRASTSALLSGLKAMGAPLERPADAAEAVRAKLSDIWGSPLEPVQAVWTGSPGVIPVRLPQGQVGRAEFEILLEGGEELAGDLDMDRAELGERAEIDGRQVVRLMLPLPQLPSGYHDLRLRVAGREATSRLIVAPGRSPEEPRARRWGVFLPLYALRSNHDWGIGDLTGLLELVSWTSGLGGSVVFTLPLFAQFLEPPADPSPYIPASRLFYNEIYIDVNAAPGLENSDARSLIEDSQFARELHELKQVGRVDYDRIWTIKRRILERLAEDFYRSPPPDGYVRFLQARPEAEDYARFRAAGERTGRPWWEWPAASRREAAGEVDKRISDFHLFSQWLVHDQLDRVSRRCRDDGIRLCLDMPLGVHPAGFDTYRYGESFAQGATVGAPPDRFFSEGQNWGFPPLHPDGIRQTGYAYLIDCLRSCFRFASALRVDHVLGLHRLYWIPQGAEPSAGIYVRYPADELYAVHLLEAHRAEAIVIGEDLGTVPREVRRAMDSRGLLGTYVFQIEVPPAKPRPGAPPSRQKSKIRKVPARSLAALNTHDMPPFRSYWDGADAAARGFGDGGNAGAEVRTEIARFLSSQGHPVAGDETDSSDVNAQNAMRAALKFLASSRARAVIVNLEDLWLEREPQNVPGSVDGPVWRRQASRTMESFSTDPEVVAVLQELDRVRRRSV